VSRPLIHSHRNEKKRQNGRKKEEKRAAGGHLPVHSISPFCALAAGHVGETPNPQVPGAFGESRKKKKTLRCTLHAALHAARCTQHCTLHAALHAARCMPHAARYTLL